MTGYQIGTLIAFLATLGAIVILSSRGQHVPAEIAGAFGSLLTAILPSISARVSINAAKASMHPPPLPKKDEESPFP